MWVAHHIVVEEGEENNNTACGLHAASLLKRKKKATTQCVDCMPYRRRSRKRKQRHGGGLHAVSLLKREKIKKGEESNDIVVGCMPYHCQREKEERTWHVGCTPRHRLPCLLLPSYPPFSLSFNPPNWLSLSFMWLLG